MIYQKDIKIIIKELKTIIPSTLKHNTYIAKIKTIEQETILKTTENIQKIQEDALKDNIGILQTKDGFALIILKENKKDQLTDEDFKNLPKKDQEELTKNLKKYQQKLEQIVISLPNKEQQKKDKIKIEEVDESIEKQEDHILDLSSEEEGRYFEEFDILSLYYKHKRVEIKLIPIVNLIILIIFCVFLRKL
jgi:hypothetical protein